MAARDGGNRALLDWWRTRVNADVRDRLQFAAQSLQSWAASAAGHAPGGVGTIHSVKGGQADVVYLFPDLSRAGDAQYNRAARRAIPSSESSMSG